MKNKIKKFCIIICIMMLIITIFSNGIMAADTLEKFSGNPEGGLTGGEKVQKIMASVLEVVRIVGAGIATFIILVIGIKYVIASAGERADIKKYATTYVVGAIVLFGASGILGILQEIILDSLEGGT